MTPEELAERRRRLEERKKAMGMASAPAPTAQPVAAAPKPVAPKPVAKPKVAKPKATKPAPVAAVAPAPAPDVQTALALARTESEGLMGGFTPAVPDTTLPQMSLKSGTALRAELPKNFPDRALVVKTAEREAKAAEAESEAQFDEAMKDPAFRAKVAERRAQKLQMPLESRAWLEQLDESSFDAGKLQQELADNQAKFAAAQKKYGDALRADQARMASRPRGRVEADEEQFKSPELRQAESELGQAEARLGATRYVLEGTKQYGKTTDYSITPERELRKGQELFERTQDPRIRVLMERQREAQGSLQLLAQAEAEQIQRALNLPTEKIPVSVGFDPKGRASVGISDYETPLFFKYREELAKDNGFDSWQTIADEVRQATDVAGADNAEQIIAGRVKDMQAAIEKEALRKAKSEVYRAFQGARNVTLYDPDPEMTNLEIADGIPFIRDFEAVFTPIPGLAITPEAQDLRPERAGARTWRLMNMVSAIPAGRMQAWTDSDGPARVAAGGTDAASAVLEGLGTIILGTTSTPEDAKRLAAEIRKDPILAGYFAEQMGNAYEASVDKADPTTKALIMVAGGAGGLVMDFAMPDPASLSLLGAGKVAQKAFSVERKMGKLAKEVMSAAEMDSFGAAIEAVAKTDPVGAVLLEHKVAADSLINPQVRGAIVGLERKADEAEQVVKNLIEKAEKEGIDVGKMGEDVPLAREIAVAKRAAAAAQLEAVAGKRAAIEATIATMSETSGPLLETLKKTAARYTKAMGDLPGAQKALSDFEAANKAVIDEYDRLGKVVTDADDAAKVARKPYDDAVAAKAQEAEVARNNVRAAEDALAEAKATAAGKKTPELAEAQRKLVEARRAAQDLSAPSHPANVAIIDARTAMRDSRAAADSARKSFNDYGTVNADKLRENQKLARRVEGLQKEADAYGTTLRTNGIDPNNPVIDLETALKRQEDLLKEYKTAEKAAAAAIPDAEKRIALVDRIISGQAKAESAAERAARWRKTFRTFSGEVQQGGGKYVELSRKIEGAVEPRFRDVLKGIVDEIPAPGPVTRTGEGAGFYRLNQPIDNMLIAEAGRFSNAPEAVVAELKARRDGLGQLINRLANNPDEVLSLRDVSVLQRELPTAFRTAAIKAADPDIQVVRAIEIARRGDTSLQPSLRVSLGDALRGPSPVGDIPAALLRSANNTITSWFRGMDPILAVTGIQSSEEMNKLIRMAANISSQMNDEFMVMVNRADFDNLDPNIVRAVAKAFELESMLPPTDEGVRGWIKLNARRAKQFIPTESAQEAANAERRLLQLAAFVQYMDTTDGLAYVGGRTFTNTMSDKTVWQLGRGQMLDDPRIQRKLGLPEYVTKADSPIAATPKTKRIRMWTGGAVTQQPRTAPPRGRPVTKAAVPAPTPAGVPAPTGGPVLSGRFTGLSDVDLNTTKLEDLNDDQLRAVRAFANTASISEPEAMRRVYGNTLVDRLEVAEADIRRANSALTDHAEKKPGRLRGMIGGAAKEWETQDNVLRATLDDAFEARLDILGEIDDAAKTVAKNAEDALNARGSTLFAKQAPAAPVSGRQVGSYFSSRDITSVGPTSKQAKADLLPVSPSLKAVSEDGAISGLFAPIYEAARIGQLKMTEEAIDDVARIADARARAWAKWNNTEPERWYSTVFSGGIEVSPFNIRGPNALGFMTFPEFVREGNVVSLWLKTDQPLQTLVHELGHAIRFDLAFGPAGPDLAMADEIDKLFDGGGLFRRLFEEQLAWRKIDMRNAEFVRGAGFKGSPNLYAGGTVGTLESDARMAFRRKLTASEAQKFDDAEERFANGFLQYLRTGDAPTPGLKGVFERMTTWLYEIIRPAFGWISPIDSTLGQRKFFARLLDAEGTATKRTTPARPKGMPKIVEGDVVTVRAGIEAVPYSGGVPSDQAPRLLNTDTPAVVLAAEPGKDLYKVRFLRGDEGGRTADVFGGELENVRDSAVLQQLVEKQTKADGTQKYLGENFIRLIRDRATAGRPALTSVISNPLDTGRTKQVVDRLAGEINTLRAAGLTPKVSVTPYLDGGVALEVYLTDTVYDITTKLDELAAGRVVKEAPPTRVVEPEAAPVPEPERAIEAPEPVAPDAPPMRDPAHFPPPDPMDTPVPPPGLADETPTTAGKDVTPEPEAVPAPEPTTGAPPPPTPPATPPGGGGAGGGGKPPTPPKTPKMASGEPPRKKDGSIDWEKLDAEAEKGLPDRVTAAEDEVKKAKEILDAAVADAKTKKRTTPELLAARKNLADAQKRLDGIKGTAAGAPPKPPAEPPAIPSIERKTPKGTQIRYLNEAESDPQGFFGLSRSWLPDSYRANLSEDDVLRLERSAYSLLRENAEKGGTFLDYMLALKQKTPIFVNATDPGVTRVMGFGARSVAHARMMDAVTRAYQSAVGTIPEQAVGDVIRLLSGDYSEIKNYNEVLRVFNTWGQSVTQTTAKGFNPMGESAIKTLQLVRVAQNPKGEQVWMTNRLVDEIEENLPKIVKELAARNAVQNQPILNQVGKVVDGAISAWKTSVVTGLLVPNPRYFVNNMAGDLSQMWFEMGAGTAMKQSFQNLPANIPWLGRVYQNFGSELAAKYGNKPVLGSVLNALFNPYLSRVWNGQRGYIRTAQGMNVSLDDLRKAMADYGILDTVVHEELPRAFSDVIPNFWKRTIGGWQEEITHFSSYVQQRQRSGLFLQLVRQGYTIDEAARLTLNALYDWKNAIARGELAGLASRIPFYRFWKLAMRQYTSAWVEPLVRPTSDMLGKALRGETKLARGRQQYQLVDRAANEMLPQYQTDKEYQDIDEKMNDMARFIYPSWAVNRGVSWSTRLSDEYQRQLQVTRGTYVSDAMITLPKLTVLDSSAMWDGMVTAMIGGAAELSGYENVAPDWQEQAFMPFLEQTDPIIKEVVMGYMQDGMNYQGPRVSGFEMMMMDKLPFMDTPRRDNETGQFVGDPKAVMAFRMMPFVGLQLGPIMNDYRYENPARIIADERAQQIAKLKAAATFATDPAEAQTMLQQARGIEDQLSESGTIYDARAWFLSRRLGLGPYPYSMQGELDRMRRDTGRRLDEMTRDIEKPEFPGWTYGGETPEAEQMMQDLTQQEEERSYVPQPIDEGE